MGDRIIRNLERLIQHGHKLPPAERRVAELAVISEMRKYFRAQGEIPTPTCLRVMELSDSYFGSKAA